MGNTAKGNWQGQMRIIIPREVSVIPRETFRHPARNLPPSRAKALAIPGKSARHPERSRGISLVISLPTTTS